MMCDYYRGTLLLRQWSGNVVGEVVCSYFPKIVPLKSQSVVLNFNITFMVKKRNNINDQR